MKSQTFVVISKSQSNDLQRKIEHSLDFGALLIWSAEDRDNWYFIFQRN